MRVPPGPSSLEAFRFFGRGSLSGMLLFLEDIARRFGPVSSFRILHRRIYLIDDPDLIREILVTRQHEFARDNGATLLRELVGDSLITREEPLHKERRRVLQPAFHRAQIASYARSMSAEADRLAERWEDGAEIDLAAEMRRLTLSIVGESLFGADFSSSTVQIGEVMSRIVRKSAWLAPSFTLLERFVLAFRRIKPNAPSLFFKEEREELERIVNPIIEKRRTRQENDVISLLLSQNEQGQPALTMEEIRDEIVTFVLAGHETTATALAWAFYLLASHPQAADRLHREAEDVLGDRPATLEEVGKLPYAAAVFKEALRLYPSAAAFGRRPKQTLELGGYVVPRGTSIFVSPYLTQRNPKYFDHPAEFKPERWVSLDIPKFAFFPFGGGAKMCIGEPFARMEGVLVLAAIARRWSFHVADNWSAPPVGPLIRPDQAVKIKVRSRRPLWETAARAGFTREPAK